MSHKKPGVAFDRVSSKDQRDGFSLDAQEKLSERYSKENNLIIVKRWSVDESASKEEDRKHFFEMISYVTNNDIKDVVFDKVDRACRGLKSAQMIEDLIDKGVKFHFARDGLTIDSNSPASEKLRFYLHVILAKYYIDNLKVEIKKGLDERQESGFWNHMAPLGYRNTRINHEGQETKDQNARAIVVPDENVAPLIRQVFERYATGNYAMKDLTEFLNHKLNDRKVGHTLMESLLSNPFYYGGMKSKKKVLPGKHTPIISKPLWDACQKIRGLRSDKHQSNLSKLVSKPFMNFLRCGACAHLITGQAKKKPNNKTYVYYHCANMNCPERKKYTSQSKIEQQIINAFGPFTRLTPVATKAFMEILRGAQEDVDIYARKSLTDLIDEQRLVKKGIAQVESLCEQDKLSKKDCGEFIEKKKAELVEIEVEMESVIKANSATFELRLKVIELLRTASDFMKLSENQLEKVRFAKIVLSNLILKNGTVEYDYQKPFDVLIDLTGKKNWWALP